MKKLHLEGNRGYAHGFASPTAPSLGRRGREDDEYHVPDPAPSTWYIRANGKIIKDKMGTPFQYRDKEAARKAAQTMMSKPFNAGKKFALTVNPTDEQSVAEAAGPVTHRIGLTVTDPNHPMVSKRGETIQKTVRVKGDDREKAINGAIAHYRRKGYKVHDHHYIGTVDAETMAETGKGISKDAETKFHAKLDTLVHDTFGKRDSEQGVAEGVAETLPMSDAVKVLKHYGADHFKTTSNELHFYTKNGRGLSVDLVWNDDATRSVNLSSLNSATRALKGQGVAEGSKYKCSCHPGDPDPDCPVHGLEPMEVGDALDVKKGVAEAKAATASFRAGDKKRAKLNSMSDEERRAHDKEQQEKQRKRDDARLERERSKNVAEGATGAKPGWMLKQDPALAKKVKDSKRGHEELKKWAGKPVPKDDKQVEEGAELKQTKRKYNQAAKDANDDQVGAGKTIDNMKKSLRQKDVDNKKQGMAEGKKPDNYHIVDKDGKPASLASYADRASAEKDRDAKHPGAEVRQVGPRGKVKGVSEDAEPMDREFTLVKKLGRLGERIVQNPKLWDKYSEVAEGDDPDWIISLIQDGTGATFEEVLRLSDLFGEIGGGLGRIIDFAWAVKEGHWEEDFLNPYREYRSKRDMAESGLGLDYKRNRFKSLHVSENAEELSVGDPVIISGQGIEFEGKTGDIDSFGDMKRFVVVNLYNHGRHSFHSSDVSYNDYANKEDDLDEDMYQYNREDPYNSEFAPRAGMGRMTLRGWKQQMIKRTAELAQQMSAAGQDIDKSAIWDHVHAKLKSMNMDPIAQEIEQAQAELEKIRQRGGVRSRAFNK